MSFIKWCFLISFITVVCVDNLFAFPRFDIKIDNDKFAEALRNQPQLLDVLQKIKNGDKDATANINEIADQVLANLNEVIKDLGIEPIPMPGFEESFQILLIKGWVKLNDGWLRGISTLTRRGDVTITYKFPNLYVHAVLGLSKLTFDYHYEAKLLGLGPSGRMEGKSDGSKFTIDLQLDLTTLQANMNDFDLNTSGRITLIFRGSITGQIINILGAVLIPLLKPIIDLILQSNIRDGLAGAIVAYNEIICKLLGSCAEQALHAIY